MLLEDNDYKSMVMLSNKNDVNILFMTIYSDTMYYSIRDKITMNGWMTFS